MSYIFRVEEGEPEKIQSVSFSEIGIEERTDLEKWVVRHPDLLEENLLIITTEFDRFEKSSKRLDVLALDSDGMLVIIELKLDISRTLADLQAIRYAAFCSTMTMADVVGLFAKAEKITKENAETKIREFLLVEGDELPDLGDKPRIILAAGSIDDQELTSTVIWLRKFEIDISCVELTPYRMSGSIVLVPRTIIPIPEARDYEIQVQRKEKELVEREVLRKSFWTGLLDKAKSKSGLHANRSASKDSYISAGSGIYGLTFNYTIRQHDATVELYIDRGIEEVNKRIYDDLIAFRPQIEEALHESSGEPLDWERLEGKQACRIKKTISEGGYRDNEEDWPKIQEAMIDAMIRLEKALRPHIDSLQIPTGTLLPS